MRYVDNCTKRAITLGENKDRAAGRDLLVLLSEGGETGDAQRSVDGMAFITPLAGLPLPLGNVGLPGVIGWDRDEFGRPLLLLRRDGKRGGAWYLCGDARAAPPLPGRGGGSRDPTAER